MFRNMANSVIEKEQIITTVQKAKEVRRVVDRLITLGKSASPHAQRLAFDRTRNQAVVRKLFTALAERYKERAGGYTRVLKISDRRWGDSAEMAVLELVDHPELDRKKKPLAKTSDEATAPSTDAADASKDPFKGIRKMFAAKSKVKTPGAAKASRSRSGTASRKSPAGGSANRSGGSS
jgi:large subunit ribosomal protein L17